MTTPDGTPDKTALLKRKRKNIRSNITRFSAEINNLEDGASNEDLEYTVGRLIHTLKEMKLVDDEIHVLLSDAEYEADIVQCETYSDNAERAIFKGQKRNRNTIPKTINDRNDVNFDIENTNLATNLNVHPQPVQTTPVIPNYTVKLPTIKLEQFGGDLENWQTFWEQFQSSVDSNPNLSPIDKHVFLRGYLTDTSQPHT